MPPNQDPNIITEQSNTLEVSVKILLRGVNYFTDRILSFSIFVVIMVIAILSGVKVELGSLSAFIYYLGVYFVYMYFYYFLSELIFNRTPGKFITQTQVIKEGVGRPSMAALAIRTICRIIPFNEFSVFILKGRTFHDKFSHTDVELSRFLPSELRLRKPVNIIFTVLSYAALIPLIGLVIWGYAYNMVVGEQIAIPNAMPQGMGLYSVKTVTYNEDDDYVVLEYRRDGKEIILTWQTGSDFDKNDKCGYVLPTNRGFFVYDKTDKIVQCNELVPTSDSYKTGEWYSVYKMSDLQGQQDIGRDLADYYLAKTSYYRLNIKQNGGTLSDEEVLQMFNSGYTEVSVKDLQEQALQR